MNSTPRTLNRVTLIFFSLIFIVVGTHWMGSVLSPEYVRLSDAWIGRTPLNELGTISTPVVGVVLLAALLFCIGSIGLQGRGRVANYVRIADPDGEPRGVIEVSDSAVEQAIRGAVKGRNDIATLTASVWRQPGRPGLRIKVQPRKGVAPGPIGREVLDIAHSLQSHLGVDGPVLVHVVSGAKARWGREERVS